VQNEIEQKEFFGKKIIQWIDGLLRWNGKSFFEIWSRKSPFA